jgi:hypothetical protein
MHCYNYHQPGTAVASILLECKNLQAKAVLYTTLCLIACAMPKNYSCKACCAIAMSTSGRNLKAIHTGSEYTPATCSYPSSNLMVSRCRLPTCHTQVHLQNRPAWFLAPQPSDAGKDARFEHAWLDLVLADKTPSQANICKQG